MITLRRITKKLKGALQGFTLHPKSKLNHYPILQQV